MSTPNAKPYMLTLEQAIDLLPEGEQVHTQRNGGCMLVGADFDRAYVIAKMTASSHIALTGPIARRMGHGMAINADGILYIATDRAKLAALDPAGERP